MNSDIFDVLECLTSMETIIEEAIDENGELSSQSLTETIFERIRLYAPQLEDEVSTFMDIWNEMGREDLTVGNNVDEPFEDLEGLPVLEITIDDDKDKPN